MSERNIVQVKQLLKYICGRNPQYQLLVECKNNSFNLTLDLCFNKTFHNITADGTSETECLRDFYGKLLALITQHNIDYVEIAREIYRTCTLCMFCYILFQFLLIGGKSYTINP